MRGRLINHIHVEPEGSECAAVAVETSNDGITVVVSVNQTILQEGKHFIVEVFMEGIRVVFTKRMNFKPINVVDISIFEYGTSELS